MINFRKVSALIIATSLLSGCSMGTSGALENSTVSGDEGVLGNTSTINQDVSDEQETLLSSINDIQISDGGYNENVDLAAATTIAFQDGGIDVSGTGAVVSDEKVVISNSGTYVLSGEWRNGQIIVDTSTSGTVQLVMDNVTIHCEDNAPIYVKNADDVVITLLEGTVNTLSDGAEYNLGDDENNVNGVIYSRDDLIINGNGKLVIDGNYKHGIVSRDNLLIISGDYEVSSPNHGIVGKDSIVIADGTFDINSGKDGLQSDNTKEEKGYIYIQDGTFNIVSGNDGIQAESILQIDGGQFEIFTSEGSENASTSQGNMMQGNRPIGGGFAPGSVSESDDEDGEASTKGLKARGAIIINEGDFNIDAYDDTIHSDGDITINGGNMILASGDDGIHADNVVIINDGVIDIVRSYEGIEGHNIIINGGEISIVASDDGINAASSEASAQGNKPMVGGSFDIEVDPYLLVTGGIIEIDAASGDGIDSNGGFFVEGGEIYVNGPTNGPDAAIDYDSILGEISGGIVVAVGNSTMADGFMESSTQNSILYNLSTNLKGGEELTLTDSNGNQIISFMPKRDYNSVVISSPELVQGETYILASGSESFEIELSTTSTVTSNSQGMMGSGGRGNRQTNMQGGGELEKMPSNRDETMSKGDNMSPERKGDF